MHHFSMEEGKFKDQILEHADPRAAQHHTSHLPFCQLPLFNPTWQIQVTIASGISAATVAASWRGAIVTTASNCTSQFSSVYTAALPFLFTSSICD